LLHVLTLFVIPKLVDQLQGQIAQAFIARATEVFTEVVPVLIRRITGIFLKP